VFQESICVAAPSLEDGSSIFKRREGRNCNEQPILVLAIVRHPDEGTIQMRRDRMTLG
jgi:hypothetical protein